MVRLPNGPGLTIHAQAGKRLIWGEGGGEGYPVSSSILSTCIRERKPVATLQGEGGGDPTASMAAFNIEAVAAAPIAVKDEIVGIIYLDRREGHAGFNDGDLDALRDAVKVFRGLPGPDSGPRRVTSRRCRARAAPPPPYQGATAAAPPRA